jgi:hypothetical protein
MQTHDSPTGKHLSEPLFARVGNRIEVDHTGRTAILRPMWRKCHAAAMLEGNPAAQKLLRPIPAFPQQ